MIFKNNTSETFKSIDETFAALLRTNEAHREMLKILMERIERLERARHDR